MLAYGLAYGHVGGDDWDPLAAMARTDTTAPPSPMCAKRVMGELQTLIRSACACGSAGVRAGVYVRVYVRDASSV